jgi:hypothetical protein
MSKKATKAGKSKAKGNSSTSETNPDKRSKDDGDSDLEKKDKTPTLLDQTKGGGGKDTGDKTPIFLDQTQDGGDDNEEEVSNDGSKTSNQDNNDQKEAGNEGEDEIGSDKTKRSRQLGLGNLTLTKTKLLENQTEVQKARLIWFTTEEYNELKKKDPMLTAKACNAVMNNEARPFTFWDLGLPDDKGKQLANGLGMSVAEFKFNMMMDVDAIYQSVYNNASGPTQYKLQPPIAQALINFVLKKQELDKARSEGSSSSSSSSSSSNPAIGQMLGTGGGNLFGPGMGAGAMFHPALGSLYGLGVPPSPIYGQGTPLGSLFANNPAIGMGYAFPAGAGAGTTSDPGLKKEGKEKEAKQGRDEGGKSIAGSLGDPPHGNHSLGARTQTSSDRDVSNLSSTCFTFPSEITDPIGLDDPKHSRNRCAVYVTDPTETEEEKKIKEQKLRERAKERQKDGYKEKENDLNEEGEGEGEGRRAPYDVPGQNSEDKIAKESADDTSGSGKSAKKEPRKKQFRGNSWLVEFLLWVWTLTWSDDGLKRSEKEPVD